jgi:hypothetical protein
MSNISESHTAMMGGLYVQSIYPLLGNVSLSVNKAQARQLNKAEVDWLLENTEATITKIRITVEEIKLCETDEISPIDGEIRIFE